MPGMLEWWLSLRKPMTIIYHLNPLKEQKNIIIIISIDVEKYLINFNTQPWLTKEKSL